ncbi:GntR family transcriptional regulator [Escherichia coli]|uniref:GntR family transcriptional regulator n=1 Tax=Escherichia coli TaxID=562 RepID=UPI0019184984|nr:GntR family transcriptional regulator [Escherichia coli]EHE8225752.1 GntR family transcriptional regulator [Escherichia coli]
MMLSIDSTVKSHVYEWLKKQIIIGELAFGTKISESAIANKFNISKSPVRGAIQRLVQEGLLTVKAKKGTFVTILDSKNLIDMMKFRSILECGSLEIVIMNNKCEVLGCYLNEFIQKCRKDITDENWDMYYQHDYQFHASLVQCAENQYLLTAHKSVSESIMAIMNHLGKKDKSAYASQNIDEHQEIVDCLINGSYKAALTLLKVHLDPNQKPYLLENI